MKVCVVGNSHAAALQMALSEGWQRDDVTVHSYIIPGRNSPILECRENKFFPRRNRQSLRTTVPDAADRGLDLADFDAVIVSAFGVVAPPPRSANNNPLFPLNIAHCFDWGEVTDRDGPSLVSRAYMSELLKSLLCVSGTFQFCREATEIFKKPILVQPVPRPTSAILELEEHSLRGQYGLDAGRVYADFFGMRSKAAADLLETLPPTVTWLPVPEGTSHDGVFSDAAFQWKDDPSHMNAAYGARVLDQILDLLHVGSTVPQNGFPPKCLSRT